MEYTSGAENVVVAAAYTWPAEFTARPALVRDERKKVEVKVEEALEMRPFVKPMVVEVLLPHARGVNGKLLVICDGVA